MAKKRYYGDMSNDVTDNMALKKGAQKAAMISEDYSAPGKPSSERKDGDVPEEGILFL